jgi:transposase
VSGVTAFAQQWNVDGILVADSALYSAANLAQMGDLRWITRVPLTLAEAQALVGDLPAETFEASERDGYRLASVCSTYGGVKQLWVVVENQARVDSDRRQLERQVDKHRQQAETQLRRQGKTDFNCAEDARSQAQTLAARWRYHALAEVQVVEHPHYERAGRPKADASPSRITYRLTAQVVADDAAIARAKRKAGRFILATNALDDPTMTAEQVLSDYKGQYAPERSFGLLKDPLFFTSSVFLKTPQRIAALAMVMGLAVMVYTLAQRQLRHALAQANETVLDQRKQPTQTPTLRWIFQSFQAIHRVVFNGQVHISNLSSERLKVLRCLGAPCQNYYLTG